MLPSFLTEFSYASSVFQSAAVELLVVVVVDEVFSVAAAGSTTPSQYSLSHLSPVTLS